MKVDFDRFYKYDELTKLIKSFVKKYPDLLALESIGKSHEGRDIWVLTATNQKIPAAQKPAFWVDANIHATELTGSTAVLYLLKQLMEQYGKDERITRLLDTRALYLAPRVNPDGAEWAMADKPKLVRSSTRAYPFLEDPIDGLSQEDIDGDGRILMMRIKDANGPWKKHSAEPRMMVRRDPTEVGGEYYRIVPEGLVKNYDGYQLPVNKNKEGLDLNRNFPEKWRQEFEQFGAGDYPTSEPEVRACVNFWTSRKNICGGVFFHTWSGVLLRPYGTVADEEMPPEDLWVFQTIGKHGEKTTGYPAISVYHEFRYHPKDVITGTQDWLYSDLGAFAWVVEIWCPMREAGITGYKYIDWFRDHPVEDDLKMLKWADDALEGKGYVDWYSYDHPQLGKVELGGWDKFYAFSNPAPKFREREVAKFPEWIIEQALMSPQLQLVEAKKTEIAPQVFSVDFVVQNVGYLPTYVSKVALKRKITRGVIGEISGEGKSFELIEGKSRIEGPQLEGRTHYGTLTSFFPIGNATPDRHVFRWVVRGKAGTKVSLTASHERGGTVTHTLKL
jgi:murein tripeptide amidase MpaA